MKIKKRTKSDMSQIIHEQCKWCAALEPNHTCNGVTFWGVMCPLHKHNPNYGKMIDAVNKYCSICQALNHDDELHNCNNKNCKLNQLWKASPGL